MTPETQPKETLITLTVDGKPVKVKPGTTVLQACEQAGSPVPFYCYHPGLTIAGNCRICLVDIEGAPKLAISCHTVAAEGMVVHTQNEKAVEGRKNVLEFILSNHPLDCPVCDQAGECWLQDYYMNYGLYDPRFNEQKTKKPKAVPLGPTVMLDAERCILCSRCVRFTDEISKTSELGIFDRGHHAEVGVREGKVLDNPYSGNVVDICPVGALTDRDFRFKCRVWYLADQKSVCPGCSKGCNILIHYNRERDWRGHIADGARVMRLKPRYNGAVNAWWMCDEGRYGYKAIDENRITRVLQREGEGQQLEEEWEAAYEAIAKAVKGAKRIGAVLSSHQTNEELFYAKELFASLGAKQIAFQRPPAGFQDDFLIRADKSPNARGAQALGITEGAEPVLQAAAKGEIDALFIFIQDLNAVADPGLVRKALAVCKLSVFIGPNHNAASALAGWVLPSASYAEKDGTFTNEQGRVQRIFAAFPPLGEARVDLVILNELAKACGAPAADPEPRAVFHRIAETCPAFVGMCHGSLGDQGLELKR